MTAFKAFPTDDTYKEVFPEIRSCSRTDFKDTLQRLLSDTEIKTIAMKLDPTGQMLNLASSFQTLDDFQQGFILERLVPMLFSKSVDSVQTTGHENSDADNGCIFLSNHRDIIMDSTLLQSQMYRLFHKPTESAIGDNLTKKEWIHDLTRLCKCFTVKRALSTPTELYKASLQLSDYIHRSVTEGHEFIWLAQREGRAKDSDDRTQPGVLKMLTLSAKGDIREHLSSLHITPLSLSYEYDPCDALKARELLMKQINGTYQKQPGEDILSMKTGITGRKGRVNICICEPLDKYLNSLDKSLPANAIIRKLSSQADNCIHRSYNLFPNNYVAASLLQHIDKEDITGFHSLSEEAFCDKFTPKDLESFKVYMEGQIKTVADGFSKEEAHRLKLYYLMIYANPVRNQWTALQAGI